MAKRLLLPLIALALLATGCSNKDSDPEAGFTRLYGAIGSEASFCTTTVGSGLALTASSVSYQYWVADDSSGLTSTSSSPIRQAEVQVLDSSGTAVACSTTDDSGDISMTVPSTPGSYTVKILSRASDPTRVIASVLKNPTNMSPYSISQTYTVTGSTTSVNVSVPAASYTGTLEGGAFFILDKIYAANSFIKNQVNTSCISPLCTGFTSANKVRVFWQPGLSPAAYWNEPSSAISFFLDADDSSLGMASGIYLLGGIQGDLCQDTDHFDPSVILHEYGHFLEKDQSNSDSPGGSHSGNALIDPRLAWSEGWGNFFQGAVLGSAVYTDTRGNSTCSNSTAVTVSLDLEHKLGLPSHDYVGPASATAEGVFREVSVSRTLWDTMTTSSAPQTDDSEGTNLGFKFIWKAFSATDASGLASSGYHFRNAGLFNGLVSGLIATYMPGEATNYSDLIANEYQAVNREHYANPTTISSAAAGSDCVVTITTGGSDSLARTNDFYEYYFDGSSSAASIQLNWTRTVGSSSDLDLYIYKEDHSLNTSDFAQSTGFASGGYSSSTASPGTEVASLSGKPAGYYLIHVNLYNRGPSSTNTYYLSTSGGRLCPAYP